MWDSPTKGTWMWDQDPPFPDPVKSAPAHHINIHFYGSINTSKYSIHNLLKEVFSHIFVDSMSFQTCYFVPTDSPISLKSLSMPFVVVEWSFINTPIGFCQFTLTCMDIRHVSNVQCLESKLFQHYFYPLQIYWTTKWAYNYIISLLKLYQASII